MIYDVNFSDAAKKLSPPNKREPKLLAWLKVLLQPIQSLRDSIFNIYKAELFKKAGYNGQKIVLNRLLNDYLEITENPKVYIEEYSFNDSFVCFENPIISSKAYTDKLYSVNYIYTSYTPVDKDFIVYIPLDNWNATSALQKVEFESIIRDYKLYGTLHEITTF